MGDVGGRAMGNADDARDMVVMLFLWQCQVVVVYGSSGGCGSC